MAKKKKTDKATEAALLALCADNTCTVEHAQDQINKAYQVLHAVQALIDLKEPSLAVQLLDNNLPTEVDKLRNILND